MIAIEKGDKTPVPKQFYFVNNICAHLYDQFTEVFSDPLYLEMHSSSIEYNGDEKLRKAIEEGNEHVFDLLNKAGRFKDLELTISKHVFMSILGDMVNFIYESMVIAKKGKISVAYALLRKPFTDQLMMLEQILANRKDFVDRYFHDGDPRSYDPSGRNIDKKKVIDLADKKLNFIFSDADIIYSIRYDKSCETGINWMTNHALHIVTNDKSYQTEKQGLNFTFPINDKELEEYYEHYYYAVSMLLVYTAGIVDKIVFGFIDNKSNRVEKKLFQRFLACAMLYDEKNSSSSKKMYAAFTKILTTYCPICNHVNKFTKRNFVAYFFDQTFFCKKCFNPVELSQKTFEMINHVLKASKK